MIAQLAGLDIMEKTKKYTKEEKNKAWLKVKEATTEVKKTFKRPFPRTRKRITSKREVKK